MFTHKVNFHFDIPLEKLKTIWEKSAQNFSKIFASAFDVEFPKDYVCTICF